MNPDDIPYTPIHHETHIDMIERCGVAGLTAPDFEERAGRFVTTLSRDWLTEEVIAGYNLNDHQRKVIDLLKIHGKITNSKYQQAFSVVKRTASLDLSELVAAGLVEKIGITGKGVHYR